MRSFIYDQYGYILEQESNEFSYEGFDFSLNAHDQTEEQLADLETSLVELTKSLPYPVNCHLVLSRNHTFLTENEFGPVALVAAKKQEYTPEAVFKLSEIGNGLKPDKPYTVTNLIDLWEEKLTLIEGKYMEASSIDDYAYPMLNTETIYAIGLANNAIQYLVDIKHDFGDDIKRLTLQHRRIYDLRTITLFNPFNLIMDTPSRDIASLYRNGEMDIDLVKKTIRRFSLEPMEIALIIARLLFPTKTFDLLEDQYNIKRDIKKDLVKEFKSSEKDLIRIKELFQELVKEYSLRPIEWLVNY